MGQPGWDREAHGGTDQRKASAAAAGALWVLAKNADDMADDKMLTAKVEKRDLE